MAFNNTIGLRGVPRSFAPTASQGTGFLPVLPALQGLGGGGGLMGLADSLNQQQALTNEQNRARQREIEGILSSLGQQEEKDITQQFKNLASQQAQRRLDAGLSVGSVADTQEVGTAQGASDALARARARIAQMRSGFLERISEEGPDFSVLSRFAPGVGAGMAGFSGGAGGATQNRNTAGIQLGAGRAQQINESILQRNALEAQRNAQILSQRRARDMARARPQVPPAPARYSTGSGFGIPIAGSVGPARMI